MQNKRIFHDVSQTSVEWEVLRIGKVTASNFGTVMANYGKAFGEPAKKYAMRIAVETETMIPIETYNNKFMDRGHELEPFARSLYEEQTFTAVSNGGFMEFGNVGASSDGLVNEDGMIEIKSVLYNTQFANIQSGYDLSYKWQIQGNLWVYDRKWCSFVSYCPEFSKNKKLHIYRVNRDEEMIAKLKLRLEEFQGLIGKYSYILKKD